MGMRECGSLLAGKDNKRKIRPRRLARDPVVQAVATLPNEGLLGDQCCACPFCQLAAQIFQVPAGYTGDARHFEQLCRSRRIAPDRRQNEQPLLYIIGPGDHFRSLEAAVLDCRRMSECPQKFR
jgi:hypothetical protein